MAWALQAETTTHALCRLYLCHPQKQQDSVLFDVADCTLIMSCDPLQPVKPVPSTVQAWTDKSARTKIMSDEQMNWLIKNVQKAPQQWKVIGNQVEKHVSALLTNIEQVYCNSCLDKPCMHAD